MSDEKKKCDHNQVVLGPELPGTGLNVAIRHVDGDTRAILARRVSDGDPIPPGSEVLMGRRSGDVIDIHGTFRTPEAPSAHAGPARVTSQAYRSGWDSIFGGRQAAGSA